MAKKGDRYECESCGVVLVVDSACECAACDVVCCGAPMKLAKAKAAPAKAVKAAVKPAAKAAPKPGAKVSKK